MILHSITVWISKRDPQESQPGPKNDSVKPEPVTVVRANVEIKSHAPPPDSPSVTIETPSTEPKEPVHDHQDIRNVDVSDAAESETTKARPNVKSDSDLVKFVNAFTHALTTTHENYPCSAMSTMLFAILLSTSGAPPTVNFHPRASQTEVENSIIKAHLTTILIIWALIRIPTPTTHSRQPCSRLSCLAALEHFLEQEEPQPLLQGSSGSRKSLANGKNGSMHATSGLIILVLLCLIINFTVVKNFLHITYRRLVAQARLDDTVAAFEETFSRTITALTPLDFPARARFGCHFVRPNHQCVTC